MNTTWSAISIALSVAIFELLYVEEYHEIYVRGHSKSSNMVALESLSVVSYSHSTATMGVSLAVSTQLYERDRHQTRQRQTIRHHTSAGRAYA